MTEAGREVRRASVLRVPGVACATVCWPPMRSDGQINSASILEFQEWSFDRGLLDAIVPVQDYWAPIFMEHARRVVGSAR